MALASRDELTALDWIAVVITALLLLAVGATPVSVSATFLELFESFGEVEELPALTRLALSPWYGLLAPLPALILLIWGVAGRGGLPGRRASIVASFCLGLAILAVYLLGAYSPIFEVADAVGP